MKRYIPTTTVPPFGAPGSRSYRFTATQKTNVYDAIYRAGQKGLDAKEIAAAVGLAVDRIRFYLSDLKRSGYINVLGDPTIVSPTMDATEAALAAMLGMENALVAKLRENKTKGVSTTDEMNRAWVKYQKYKEFALHEPNETSSVAQVAAQKQQAQMALRMALIELVKLLF